MLFLAYMFLNLILGMIPVLGQLLPLILMPVFSIAFMQACLHIKRNQRISPDLLLTGFRSPALKNLLILGCLYPLAATIAVGMSALFDDGAFWMIMTGQSRLDPKNIEEINFSVPILVATTLYTPAAMAFWYAAPLIMWKKMRVPKAIFYSFFATLREIKAFTVYGMAWVAIAVLLPTVSVLIALLVNSSSAVVVILLPLSIVLTVVMYCSFYPTYTYVFGELEGE